MKMTPTNSTFDNQLKSFYNTTDFVQMLPNRAVLNKPKMFMAVLLEESVAKYNFPSNIFMLKNDKGDTFVPPFITSSADYHSKETKTIIKSSPTARRLSDSPQKRTLQTSATSDPSSQIPSEKEKKDTLFSNGRQYFLVPYFPYFGNCSFYGSQLFIYPIIENNPSCKLVNRQDVQPISNMRFGMTPVADTCRDIIAQCS